ncbi:hypothetical protein QTP70_010517 [Hemibagrus guttatus]|uniref:Endonuclease/exonuclease/phosphatase domain-containing protein n=1 Tax=Hemibagrus guttatus TaxID=175788 RepID=A0AAE0PX15_9TELE|nr:hypothetical protein QTP70_010517 [Hemibagrus guttatus]
MAAELGGYKQAHPSPTPLTMGHSREEEGPNSLKELGSRARDCAWRQARLSLAGTAQPPSPAQAPSPPSEVTSHVPKARFFVQATVECYNPRTNEWSYVAKMNEPHYGHAGTVYGGYMYISGGITHDTFQKELMCFDPEADRWTQKAPMTTVRGLHCMCTVGDRLYVIGGNHFRGTSDYDDVLSCEYYSPALDVWTGIAAMLRGQSDVGVAVFDNKIYVVGGYSWNNRCMVEIVQKYDPDKDEWHKVFDLPESLGGIRACTLTVYPPDELALAGTLWMDERCHRENPTNFIPDRSRPGLTTTAIGAVDLQGAGGNWATVGRRSRGGRRVHRQREKRKGKSVGLRIGTLNVGTMTGKGRELADVMERRKVDILCVQETRWKGSKARSIGAGFKLFYYGVDSKRNGVGVVLKEEFVRNVLEVKRVSDRVMSLKLEIEGVMLNVVSGYAPQVGCELEEKERFWSELDEVMESIPTGERVVIGADFNGHVGEGNTGDEEVMGKFGVKERNLEGQMVVDFAKRMDMGVVNTYFQKREEHRVTYKSGGRRTQVDYILCRRGNLKEISDCKVVVGESVARQHRMVVCRMTLMVCKTKRSKIEKKTKWWKLKKEECCEEFRQKLRQALGGQVVLPDDWETTAEVIRETGRKVLGVSSGKEERR